MNNLFSALSAGSGTLPVVSPPITVLKNGQFRYTVPSNATRSSADLWLNDKKVRNLWGNKPETPGDVVLYQWDGLLDDIKTVGDLGSYTVRILTNNVTYKIGGGIGNTGVFVGNVWRGFAGVCALAFTADRGFWGEPFSENLGSVHDFALNDLSQCYKHDLGVQAHISAQCTDGTNIYVSATDDYGVGHNGVGQSLIFAFKASDFSAVQFAAGVSTVTGQLGGAYNYYIGLETGNGKDYSAIAVNQNFIFSASLNLGKYSVYNKTTGQRLLQQDYAFKVLAASFDNQSIWAYLDNTVKKYALNNDGTIGAELLSIPYTGNLSFNISPLTNQIAISDNINHQVKWYNTSTGALEYTQGVQGGYNTTNGRLVTTNKFMFGSDSRGAGAIAFEPNGSYWLADQGNNRLYHFAADHSFITFISFIPACRATCTDLNDPSRIFADCLEYHRDYSKPISDPTSWYLKYNWSGTNINGFMNVFTLENGITYTYFSIDNQVKLLHKLVPEIGAVNSNQSFFYFSDIEHDGSIYQKNGLENYTKSQTVKRNKTGFGSNGEIIWGDWQQVAITPTLAYQDTMVFKSNNRGCATNPNRQFYYNPDYSPQTDDAFKFGCGYHLGSIKTGETDFEWQALNSTYNKNTSTEIYEGEYPRNGWFDIGNSPGHHSENCMVNIYQQHVITHVNGEFWGAYNSTGNKPGAEINISNHFHESGLPIGCFGQTAQEATYAVGGNAGFAGNSFATSLNPANGKLYYRTCDESAHGAVSEWEIDNLDTIKITEIELVLNQPITVDDNPFNLLDKLPYRSTNFTGNSIWNVKSPSGLIMRTNFQDATPENVDLAIFNSGSMVVEAKLPNTKSLFSWKVYGKLSFEISENTFGSNPDNGDVRSYLEILDQDGKIICRFIQYQVDTNNNYYPRVWINHTLIAEGKASDSIGYALGGYRNILFKYTAGIGLTVTWRNLPPTTITQPFETGANMSAPAFFRINQQVSNRLMGLTIANPFLFESK